MAATRSDEYNAIWADWNKLLKANKGAYDKIPATTIDAFLPRIASASMSNDERRFLMHSINSLKSKKLKQKPKNFERVSVGGVDSYLFSPTGEVLSASEVRTLRERDILEGARSARIAPKDPPVITKTSVDEIKKAKEAASKGLKGFSRRNMLLAGLAIVGLTLVAGPAGLAAGLAGGFGAIGAGALSVGATIASFGTMGLGVGILGASGIGAVRQIIRGRRDPYVLESKRLKAVSKFENKINYVKGRLNAATRHEDIKKFEQELEGLYAKKVKSQQKFADLARAQHDRIIARGHGGIRRFLGENVALGLFHNSKYVDREQERLTKLTITMNAANKTVEADFSEALTAKLDVNKTHGKAFAKELEKAPEERNINTAKYDELYSKAITDTFKASSKDYVDCKNFAELAQKFSDNTGISKDYINARKADFLVQYAQNRDSSLGGLSDDMQKELTNACVEVLKGGAGRILDCEKSTIDFLQAEVAKKDSPIHEAFVESGVPQPKEGEELTEKQQEKADKIRKSNEEKLETTMNEVQGAQNVAEEISTDELAANKAKEDQAELDNERKHAAELEKTKEEIEKARAEAEKAAAGPSPTH